MAQIIVVGGGLAGLSAAHTLLERGANVVLLDKQGLADIELLFRGKVLIQSQFYGWKLHKGNVRN
jgi:glycine/D-amino acid oxidase-like deaminating enzyme